jgi:hypothetical protein
VFTNGLGLLTTLFVLDMAATPTAMIWRMRRKSSWSKDLSPNIGGVFGLLGNPNSILVSAVGASLRPLAD